MISLGISAALLLSAKKKNHNLQTEDNKNMNFKNLSKSGHALFRFVFTYFREEKESKGSNRLERWTTRETKKKKKTTRVNA